MCYLSAEKKIVVAGTVGQNSGVDHLAAAGALPGIERPDEIVVLLREHRAFASRTCHEQPPVVGS